MGISFLNGGLLGALSLVSIPIIIHLLQRRRFRVVRWGAMEFLRLSQRNRSRRLMIEQLLLLLIRCLVIALVVLAVCRPVVRFAGAPVVGGRGQVHAILILDNSYSMGYRAPGADGETVFDRARRRALELVERGLRQGDAISLVLASDPPRALIRDPSLDLRAAAELIRRSVRLSDSGTDYGKAARLALEIASASSFANREVYLISDNQAAGWDATRDPPVWEALGKAARLVLLPVREGPAPNVAVEAVRVVRGLATARSDTRIQARIANRGAQPLRGLLVRLEVDGKPQGPALRADVEPGKTAVVTFDTIFERPGLRACTVRIAGDRLPADDTGYLALNVRKNLRVLVLNGKPAPRPQEDAAFFLRLALAPPPAPDTPAPEAAAPVELDVAEGSSFGSRRLQDYDVVALADVPALADPDRRALAEFLQNGGGVLVFPGGRVDPALYNRDLFAARPRLLPARMGPPTEARLALDSASMDHPALQRFRGSEDVDVGTAEFRKYFPLRPAEDDRSVRVMARFTNGAPALVEKQFGLGRIVLAASTANTEWNDLPLKPLFLPLAHQLVAYLAAGTDGNRNATVGEPLVKPLPLAEGNRPVTVAEPDGTRRTLRPVVDERGALAILENTRTAGFYRVAAAGGTDLFAVNRDPRESDLTALDRAELDKRLPPRSWAWIGWNEDLVSALDRTRQGVELWRHLLVAALALLAIETALAQAFGRRA